MTRINTNVPSLLAQIRLRANTLDVNLALTRLSSGLRINRSADDPLGVIASESLRSEITAFNQAILNTRRASQVITTAESALGRVSHLLQEIRGLIVETANEGALSEAAIAANQLQIDSSLEAINRIAQSTTFQGRQLLDGSFDYVSTVGTIRSVKEASIMRATVGNSPLNVEVVVNSAARQAEITSDASAFFAPGAATAVIGDDGGKTITVTAESSGPEFSNVQIVFADDASLPNNTASADYDAVEKVITVRYNSNSPPSGNRNYNAMTAAIDGLADFNATASGAGGSVPFNIPTAPVTISQTGEGSLRDSLVFQLLGADGAEAFSFAARTSNVDIAAAVNSVTDSTGVYAEVVAGDLIFRSSDVGSNAHLAIDVLSEGSNGAFAESLDSTQQAGKDVSATVNGIQASARGNTISISTNSLALSLTLDDTVGSFHFKILSGGATFQLGPEVTSTHQASIGIGSIRTAQLGGESGRLYELGSGQAKSLTSDLNGAGQIIDEVTSKIAALRGRLVVFQSTTLESNLINLTDTVMNLQEAESSIRDADVAQEAAALTRAQILVQSSTSVLALANQNPQNVLDLLQ